MVKLPGASQLGTRNAFAAGLDAGTGALEWAQQVSGRGGVSQGTGVVVDPQGDSILSKLGLPSGKIVYADSRVVTAQSAARAGDQLSSYRLMAGVRARSRLMPTRRCAR